MIYIAFLLHIYQPPTQTPTIIRRISEECYIPLTRSILGKGIPITLNINGSLIEQLNEIGIHEPLYNISLAIEENYIEITGSGAYHPIFPLVPEDVMVRQIKIQKEILRKYLGPASIKGEGFFLPEMCYSPVVDKILLNQGYKWTVISSIGAPGRKPLRDKTGKTQEGLYIMFRDDLLSNRLSFDKPTPTELIRQIKMLYQNGDSYIILALDGETFGHHVKEYRTFLSRFFELVQADPGITMVKISDILRIFDSIKIDPYPSSWSTTEVDMGKNPFPLWNDPQNEIHKLLWDSLYTMHELVKLARDTNYNQDLTKTMLSLADKAVHSCQWWWASKRPWFSVEMILNGAALHIKAARYALVILNHGCNDVDLLHHARKLWNKLLNLHTRLSLIL